MSAIMNRGDFGPVMEAYLNEIFEGIYKQLKEEWRQVYKTKDGLKRRAHEYVALAGLRHNGREKGEGNPYTFTSGGVAYRLQFLYRTFGLAYAMTQEMIEDGEHFSVGSVYAEHLARAMLEKRELEHVSLFNNAFTTPVFNGEPLLATNHAHFNGGTGSNKLNTPAQLSVASLTDLRNMVRLAKDENGRPINLKIERLIIPPLLRSTAEIVTKSVLNPSVAGSNAINPVNYMGEYGEIVELTRLSSDTAYFVQTNAPDGLWHFPRVKLNTKMDVDTHTDSAMYKARERYAYGAAGYRGLYGTEGA